MQTRLSSIFKITKVTNLTKVILQDSYGFPQVTSKCKKLKQSVYFWRQLNFTLLLTFILMLLWLYFRKSCKTTLFRKFTKISQNTPTFISLGTPITKLELFKNMKNLSFKAPYSKKKLLVLLIFNESNIWAKVYHMWKIEVLGSTIVKIMWGWSCYFILLNTVITSTQKKQ